MKLLQVLGILSLAYVYGSDISQRIRDLESNVSERVS